MLHTGPLLPAIRATCAVPGVLPPERLGGRCLVDGGVMNVLPVDLAWSWEPDIVIAVNIVASPRQTVRLDSRYARIATALGRIVPNPMTAHLAYEIAMRAVEVALDRQRALAIAMTGPEVLIDVDLGDVSIGDFHRLDEVVEIGRRATRVALPTASRRTGGTALHRGPRRRSLHLAHRPGVPHGDQPGPRARPVRARRGHVLLLFDQLSRQLRASPGSLRRHATRVRFGNVVGRSAEWSLMHPG